MKIRSLAYTSLVLALLSFSFFMPVQVNAVENNSQSDETVESKEASHSSVNELRTEQNSANNAFKSTSPEGTPSNADKPSKDGWSFLLTIFRKGFSSQPQSEQYIALQDIAKAKISGMSILTSLGNGFGKDIKVRRWHWDPSTAKWIEDKNQPKGSTGWSLIMGSLGFLDVNDYALNKSSDLSTGTYYYQFSFSEGLIFTETYYSNLAKVVITPEPVPAKSVDLSMPEVIYPDVDYKAKAIVDPIDSTDDILWKPGSTDDLLKFTPNVGRSTTVVAGNGAVNSDKQYIPDSYYTNQVNEDPDAYGIPAGVHLSAADFSGINASVDKDVYVGGLPAYNAPIDTDGKWMVGGLSDLVLATGATKPWHYAWNFTDSDGNEIKTPTSDEGVLNSSGDIATLSSLNDEQPLTFLKNSSFIKSAAEATSSNKSYKAQLTLTSSIEQEDSKKATQPITIKTNKAELQAIATDGVLELNQVPNFQFGNISASRVYTGTIATENDISATDVLKVTDTRPEPGWNLTARMSNMVSNHGNDLSDIKINMIGLPENIKTKIISNNIQQDIANSNLSGEWNVTGSLILNANPDIQLTNNEKFTSNIVWTLSSQQPDNKALN